MTDIEILKYVCEYHKIDIEKVLSGTRKKDVKECRQIAQYLIRNYNKTPYKKIGKLFNRHHSTVIYSMGVVENIALYELDYRENLEKINNQIKLKINGEQN